MTETVTLSVYESAVKGRQMFRTAFQRKRDECIAYREALDRIARFEEAFEFAADKDGGDLAGSAMAATLAKYARQVLNEIRA